MSHHPNRQDYHTTPPCPYRRHLTPPTQLPTTIRRIHTSPARTTSLDDDNKSTRHRTSRHVHFDRTPTTRTSTRTIHTPLHHNLTTPTYPTIYILTFSTTCFPPCPATITHLLSTQLPLRTPPIPHLFTLDVRSLPSPPARLCALYSGISPVMQDAVMREAGAQKIVGRAVDAVMACGARGVREVCLSVCCVAGTHRSVGVGERIAQEVKRRVGEARGEGVVVVVRHVSRVRGRGDPF